MSLDVLMAFIGAAERELILARTPCPDNDHRWESDAARACPTGCEMCSQAVYTCVVCGAVDYGYEPESPALADCKSICGDSMTGWRRGHLDIEPRSLP